MEVTRTIQIEVTGIIEDGGKENPNVLPAEWLERDIRYLFRDYDQVNVTIKNFVREEG